MTDNDRACLVTLKGHPGWDVFVNEIMADECAKRTAEMMMVNPADDKAVLAAHNTARAANQFSANVLKRMDQEIAEHRAGLIPTMSDEERELQSILTPFPVGLPEEGRK